LRIGMSTDVNVIVRQSPNALILPSGAVSGNRVAVVEGGDVRLREIEIGIRGTGGVEVLSGLEETTQVIAPFPADLAEGTRVTIAGGGSN
ncbi:efflux transporter periplasmic adaptor subunit, partial [Sinorhizobium sp. 6-117]|nr:efflux transporter periplasmic adaptor subunit [Sinorhizobium sp. 6-117]